MAAVAEAERTGADLDEEVETAAEEFRHDRGLLSVDDLESWLDRKDLSLDGWLDHVRRVVTLAQAGRPARPRRVPAEDLRKPLHADLACSGDLDRLARELAGRAAAAAIPLQRGKSGRPPAPKAAGRVPSEMPALLGMTQAACSQRAVHIASLEARFRRFVTRVTDPASVRRMIGARAAMWLRVLLRRCDVTDEDQAKELVLLVREDGLTLMEASKRAAIAMSEQRMFIEDIDSRLRDLVLGARPGELVGPVPLGRGFAVVEVVERVEPKTSDSEVLARAKSALVRDAIEREINARVRWADHGVLLAGR